VRHRLAIEVRIEVRKVAESVEKRNLDSLPCQNRHSPQKFSVRGVSPKAARYRQDSHERDLHV
jgi:hypothetical protein